MAETDESLLNLVNSSGYLLQLRLESDIENSNTAHGWEIFGHEYHWINRESGDEGFIDIVLGSQNQRALRMVIECKRVLESSWVFLIINQNSIKVHHSQLYWLHSQAERKNISEWYDFELPLTFPEAFFCVLRGQSDKDKPMLERTGGILLKSVVCLAEEEASLNQTKQGEAHIYIPVIITTASLEICQVDPADVNIENAQLPKGKGHFQKVPFLALRKGMVVNNNLSKTAANLQQANQEKGQTIFVVQASETLNFLHQVSRDIKWSGDQSPWDKAREQENTFWSRSPGRE